MLAMGPFPGSGWLIALRLLCSRRQAALACMVPAWVVVLVVLGATIHLQEGCSWKLVEKGGKELACWLGPEGCWRSLGGGWFACGWYTRLGTMAQVRRVVELGSCWLLRDSPVTSVAAASRRGFQKHAWLRSRQRPFVSFVSITGVGSPSRSNFDTSLSGCAAMCLRSGI